MGSLLKSILFTMVCIKVERTEGEEEGESRYVAEKGKKNKLIVQVLCEREGISYKML